MDLTIEQIEKSFRRQVKLCSGLGLSNMLDILNDELGVAEKGLVYIAYPTGKGHPFIPGLDADEECALCGELMGCCTDQAWDGSKSWET